MAETTEMATKLETAATTVTTAQKENATKKDAKKEEVDKEASTKPEAKQARKRKIKKSQQLFNFTKANHQVVLSIIFGMALMLLFYLVVHPHQQQQQIATVDVSKIVDEFVKKTAQQKLSPEKMQNSIEIFGKKLESTLKSMAKDKHLILMPAEAVIAGARDVTEQAREILN